MKRPRLAGIAVAAAILAAPAAAAAQPSGSQPFGAQPTAVQPADDGPVTADTAGREAALARSLFDAGRWAEAAPALARVAGGETGDGEVGRQVARFHLGVALHHLRLYDASLRVFGQIAAAPGHYGFRMALEWLATLDLVLPEPAGVARHAGAYLDLDETSYPARPDLHARVHHLLGWSAYGAGRYTRAAIAFGQVDKESPLYAESQFMRGMSFVQLRQSVPAVNAFERVVEAVGADTRDEEAKRLRNLAHSWAPTGRW